jgi:hypothetical protein
MTIFASVVCGTTFVIHCHTLVYVVVFAYGYVLVFVLT